MEEAKFAELGRKIAQQGFRVCVNGLQKDSAQIQQLCNAIGPASEPAVFDEIAEYLAFLKNARLVVGADGGGIHLASAVGTPTIAFFSETASLKWRPFAEGHTQFDSVGKPVNEITVESVWAKIVEKGYLKDSNS